MPNYGGLGDYGDALDDNDYNDWLYDDSDEDSLLGDLGGYLVEGAENLFEWGSKNPQAVLGGVIGAGKSVMDYYSKEDSGPSNAEYYKERSARHDQGMRDYVKSFNKEG